MLAAVSPRFHARYLAPRHAQALFPFAVDAFEPLDFPCFHRPTLALPTLPKIERRQDGYVVRVETPGVKKEHLKVELVGRRTLLVTASNPQPSKLAEGDTPVHEQPQPTQSAPEHQRYSLCKRIDLPHDADWSKVQLSYADGLLTVEIAKKEEGATEYGEKAAELQADVDRRLKKVEALRAELEQEQCATVQAQLALCQAKAEFARSVAEEKLQLSINA